MNLHSNHIEKVCNFYVSDWHMAVMILPYINQEINSGKKVATIFENTIKENIETLLEKLNLKNEQEIKKINWDSKPHLDTEEIEKLLQGEKQEIVFIINGSESYIKKCDKKIETYYQEHAIHKKIKIVNCFEMTSIDGDISRVLEEHSKVLNTKGEKDIEDIKRGRERAESVGSSRKHFERDCMIFMEEDFCLRR